MLVWCDGMVRLWLFTLLLAACHSANPSTLDAHGIPDAPAGTRTKVDVLFVIDDSPSTLPKQFALRARLASLEQAVVQRLDTRGQQE